MGLAPKKSLALQARQITLPGVAPISGAMVAASLASPAAPVVTSVPSVVSEQMAMTAPSQEQLDVAMVVSEGVVQSKPRRPK